MNVPPFGSEEKDEVEKNLENFIILMSKKWCKPNGFMSLRISASSVQVGLVSVPEF